MLESLVDLLLHGCGVIEEEECRDTTEYCHVIGVVELEESCKLFFLVDFDLVTLSLSLYYAHFTYLPSYSSYN